MPSRRIALSFLAPLALSIAVPKCLGLPQGPVWTSDFARPDMDRGVLDLATFDDGDGPKLYAAGEFTLAGGVMAHNVARWNGVRWSPLGTGLDQGAKTLAMYDGGQGPALYVGGLFSSAGGQVAHGIAKWNGTTWAGVGEGMAAAPSAGSQVGALAIYDDGTGRALYAAGLLTASGGAPARSIAKWDGNAWSSVGSATSPSLVVFCLQVFDDGSGPALYAGGTFQSIGGVPANNIARWNGTSWSAVGAGSSDPVECLAAYDDGSGSKLYAGGGFGGSGSNAYPLGRWDGSSWSPVGPPITTSGSVGALGVFDDGSGSRLGIGYWHAWSGAIATWDGTQWSLLPGRTDAPPHALVVHDDGNGPALYVGGFFTRVRGMPVGGIARWDGSDWSSLSSSPGAGGAPAQAMTVFDDGTGPALYVGGWFQSAGGTNARHVAKWNGAAWSKVGDGPVGSVQALAVHDDGSGPALYAAGESVEKWNGSSWSPVGAAFSGVPLAVYALAIFDDGGGPELYAGGNFSISGTGLGSHQVAKWDGSSWTSITPNNNGNDPVLSLAVFDDGTGPALYAGGSFTSIGGVSADNLAKWDGSTWSPVGGGVGSYVEAMTTFDDGSGPALYVGGNLSAAGSVQVDGVARWDGSVWSAVGAFTGSASKWVHALAVHDDGTGPALYAGGWIYNSPGFTPRGVVRLDGTRWRFLGAGTNGDVHSLASFDAGTGSDLYAGGYFTIAGRHSSFGIGRWTR